VSNGSKSDLLDDLFKKEFRAEFNLDGCRSLILPLKAQVSTWFAYSLSDY